MLRLVNPVRQVITVSLETSRFVFSPLCSNAARYRRNWENSFRPSQFRDSRQKPRYFITESKPNYKNNSSPSSSPSSSAASSSSSATSSPPKAVRYKPSIDTADEYVLPHPVWLKEDLDAVPITHVEPKDNIDKTALFCSKLIKFNFDWATGFAFGKRTENKWLTRIIFLESIAGVPGSVAATIRHLNSLRKLTRDHGWIHTLLEEAENERMHLMTALQLRQPGSFFRFMVFMSQGIFFNFFFLAYLISPRFCHRLVGYFEEEAVGTYTKLLQDIDKGDLPRWKDALAPTIAKNYWKMADDAKIREVWAAIRADESHHRDVNHQFATLKSHEQNPFKPGH